MKVLVTGAAGFIGAALIQRLFAGRQAGDNRGPEDRPTSQEVEPLEVVGLDNINDYYDQSFKIGRLAECGIHAGATAADVPWYKFISSERWPGYRFIRMNLEDTDAMAMLFANGGFDIVVNLAAQAGVRYSIENPRAYVSSNVDGFINVLEGCRHNHVGHLVYASSSSVYGLNGKTPFSESDPVNHPVSLYAATKKSNELMAHAYAKLYGLPCTGLRFFTVYGPWGRPDMSPFLFMDAILNDRPIKVFNNGDMLRDFTYIDDIVESVARIMRSPARANPEWTDQRPDPATSCVPWVIYNVGNQHPTRLMDYIREIERALGKEAKKEMFPMQPGDVYQTYADSTALAKATGFRPATPLSEGIAATAAWLKKFRL